MPSSGATSALRSAKRLVFCSRIFLAYSVFHSRTIYTSSSACWHSWALKRDIALSLLIFLLVLPASASSSGVRHFPSLSAKVRDFLRLDVVKLVARRATHTEITTFIISAVTGYGNLQYYYIGMLSYITLKFSNIGIKAIITVALAGFGKLQYYHIEILWCSIIFVQTWFHL